MVLQKSVVTLIWCNEKEPIVQYTNTGFIIKKDQGGGIFILSVGEYIPKLFKNTILKSDILVQVEFFNYLTLGARVLHYDLARNIAVVFIKHRTEFDNHPLCCLQAASLSTDPTYKGQSVEAMHHASRFGIHDGIKVRTFNQFIKGFIADNSYGDGRLVHFSMPLIFRESLGTPVFDEHSNRVVAMIKGWESGLRNPPLPINARNWCNIHNRYVGLPVPIIQLFLSEVERAVHDDPPSPPI